MEPERTPLQLPTTAITKGNLLQGVPEGTGGYGDGTTYRVCIPRDYGWRSWGTLRCDGYGTAYLVYSLRDLPRGTGVMVMVLLTLWIFLGTTDRGEHIFCFI